MNEINQAEKSGIKAALYARVSSEGQAEKDLSIPGQLKALREYAERRGWTVHAEHVDEAKSARSADRPEFQRMIGLAKQKTPPFTVILVWKLSRFARNREDSIIYKKLLRRHGVEVVSINEPIDDSPAGQLLEGMIEVVDEFYSANLASDTIRGMNENASRGFRNGSTAPFGYRIARIKVGQAEKSKLELDPVHAPTARRIFALCMDGAGSKEIAKKLNAEGRRTRSGAEWCNTGVYYILSNEVYTGVTIFNAYRYNKPGGEKPHKEIRVENTHPAIVSRDDFERIRAFLRARRPQVNNAKTLNSDYLLSGIAYCATCGAKLIGTNAKGGRFLYYGCQTYLKRGRAACDAGLISKSFLEEQVVTGLRDEVLTDEKLSTLIRLVNEERAKSRRSGREKGAEIDAQIDGLQGRLDRLCEVLETGHVSAADVGPRLKALRDQIAAAEARKAALASEDSAPVKLSDADVKRRVRDLRQLLERGSVVERKAWLRQWLKRVVVDKKADVIAEYLIPLPGQVVPDWKRESRPAGGLSNEVMSGAQIGSPSPTLFKTKTTYFMSFPLEFLMAAKATSKSCPKRSARGFAWRVYGRLAYL